MLLRSFRLRSAAKRYAAALTPWLPKAYGAKEFYTKAQLERAIARTGLNMKYRVFAFAQYLPEDEFLVLLSQLPVKLERTAAREMIARFSPIRAFPSDVPPAPELPLGGP